MERILELSYKSEVQPHLCMVRSTGQLVSKGVLQIENGFGEGAGNTST